MWEPLAGEEYIYQESLIIISDLLACLCIYREGEKTELLLFMLDDLYKYYRSQELYTVLSLLENSSK